MSRSQPPQPPSGNNKENELCTTRKQHRVVQKHQLLLSEQLEKLTALDRCSMKPDESAANAVPPTALIYDPSLPKLRPRASGKTHFISGDNGDRRSNGKPGLIQSNQRFIESGSSTRKSKSNSIETRLQIQFQISEEELNDDLKLLQWFIYLKKN